MLTRCKNPAQNIRSLLHDDIFRRWGIFSGTLNVQMRTRLNLAVLVERAAAATLAY